jgi:hypothetical protein
MDSHSRQTNLRRFPSFFPFPLPQLRRREDIDFQLIHSGKLKTAT